MIIGPGLTPLPPPYFRLAFKRSGIPPVYLRRLGSVIAIGVQYVGV